MKYSELAYKIAYKAHQGQVDKAGVDYIQHPIYIASLMDTDEEKAVAYLHDVVEDTNVTLSDLKSFGFNYEILDAVDVLTKRENDNYEEYILRVSKNELARKVKLVDLKHNSDLSRLKNITDRDLQRYKKYQRMIQFLENQ